MDNGPRQCVVCGAAFTPSSNGQRTCSAGCARTQLQRTKAAWNRMNRDRIRRGEISVLEAERAGEIVSPRLLAKAHRRPKGVSEVRWRMELRRRENGDYFDFQRNPEAMA